MISASMKNYPGKPVEVMVGYYKSEIGFISKKQDDVSGIFVDIAAAPDLPQRRLWFPLGDVKLSSRS